MNPNYAVLEKILAIDIQAGAATAEQRQAQRMLAELAKKTKANEDLIQKTRKDMAFIEGEMRRQYKKIDELDARKEERSARLYSVRTDDEHRVLKREIDNIEKEIRELLKRCDENETRIENCKNILRTAEKDLQEALAATADERSKLEELERRSQNQIAELAKIRETYLAQLDERIQQHYLRLLKVTRNPNGPIARIHNNACSNCYMQIPPQTMNIIRLGKEVEFCQNCHHILLPNTDA